MSRNYDAWLEEATTARYICPFCFFEKDVVVEYDRELKSFFPANMADTICKQCDEFMDKKGVTQ